MPKVVLDLQREQWTNTAQINHDETSDSACRTSGLCVSAPPLSGRALSQRAPACFLKAGECDEKATPGSAADVLWMTQGFQQALQGNQFKQ